MTNDTGKIKHLLKPDETIQKALISTTSRLVGEYESDLILITHAWPDFWVDPGLTRYEENPISRSAYVVAFRTEPFEKGLGSAIPDYSHVGELICSYMSLLYGKRFDYHGLLEGSGIYRLPDLSSYNQISNQRLPFNSHKERKCFNIPLNLIHFSVVADIFSDTDTGRNFLHRLNTSCKFYMQALQNAESDPETSYLNLIMAGEIMSQHFDHKAEDLLDKGMLNILRKIEKNLDDGENVVRQINARISSIKRGFVKSISSLIDDEFFLSKETDFQYGFFKAEDFCKHVGAAYDLRSKYVHTGVPFGRWIQPVGHWAKIDILPGRPVVEDKEYAKVLEKAPTLIGLERVIRYCLLKFMISNGFHDIENSRSDGDVDAG